MTSVDVTIKGAGIFGLATAWACVKAGARVRVIDSQGIGAGASGGLVGALAPHAPEKWNPLKAFQLDSLLMAESWWHEVHAAGGLDPLYRRSGRLQPLADAAALALAEERATAAKTLWQGEAEWQLRPASGAAWEPAAAAGWLIHDTLTARIFPRSACRALAAALVARGAEIRIGDQGAEQATEQVTKQGKILHATGTAGLLALSQDQGKSLGAGQKGQAALLAYDAATLPQIYAGGLHIVPHGDGTVAIGSTSESQWDSEAPDHRALELVAAARAILPALQQAPLLETWAGLRPRAKSRAPVAGAWPGRAGHYLLNGGFKIGFGMAPKLAEAMAALILDGRDDLVPEAFSPAVLLA